MNKTFILLTAIGLVPGLFFAFVLAVKKQNTLANRFLALAIGATCIFLAGHFSYYLADGEISTPWMLFSSSMGMVFSPGVFLYTALIVSHYDRYDRKLLLHFAPFLGYLIISSCYGLSQGFHIGIPGISDIPLLPKVLIGIRGAYSASYLAWAIVIGHRHGKRIVLYYSGIEKISLRWLQSLLISSGVIFFLVTVRFFLEITDASPSIIETITVFYYLSFTFWVYLVGYFAITQPEIFGQTMELKKALEEIAPREDEKTGVPTETPSIAHPPGESTIQPVPKKELPDKEARSLVEKLESLMGSEKPFLDSSLNLAQVAKRLSVTNHQLSSLLNNHIHKNFYGYVNGYRIETAKEMLQDPSNEKENIINIAYDCGFQSKSSFNTFFKKVTDMTPSEYRKQSAN